MEHPILESIDLVHRASDPGADVAEPTDDPWFWATIDAKARAYHVVEEWHRDHHVGRYELCHDQPCHAIMTAVWPR